VLVVGLAVAVEQELVHELELAGVSE